MIPPRANEHFAGHEGAVAALYEAAAGKRLHHAWLIGGQAGIGKKTLAYRFARWLLAGGTSSDLSVDPGHPVSKRVAAGTHVDLRTIERRFNEKTKKMQSIIAVDTVRSWQAPLPEEAIFVDFDTDVVAALETLIGAPSVNRWGAP